MLLLGELILPQMPGLVPFITFGSLCLVAAVLVLYLPETLGTKLPDTIEEAVAQARVSPGHQTMNRAAGQQGSSASLDVGYGKCPELVCVDGLIVSKDNGWGDGGSDSGQEQSLSMSHQGTLSTLRWVKNIDKKTFVDIHKNIPIYSDPSLMTTRRSITAQMQRRRECLKISVTLSRIPAAGRGRENSPATRR